MYIYLLLDPRTMAVRYVGKSKNPYNRVKRGHLANRFCNLVPSGDWIRELKDLSLVPEVRIVALCAGNGVKEERAEIAKQLAAGATLLNASMRPSQNRKLTGMHRRARRAFLAAMARTVSRGPAKNRKRMDGMTFGRWTVLHFSKTVGKLAYWRCRCQCGIERDVTGANLRSGISRSCGCLQRERAGRFRRIKERRECREALLGKRFGRLLVIGLSHATSNGLVWTCRCDCGNTKIIQTRQLSQGKTRSCGCLRRELTKRKHTLHGKSNTPEFRIWAGMLTRCCNPKSTHFDRYGGRGIKVCDRWRDSFAAFLADLGTRPTPRHSLDRTNNDGDYSPENCRWATSKEQCSNQSTNRRISAFGEVKHLAEWAREKGVHVTTIASRLKRGLTLEEAVTIPAFTRPIRNDLSQRRFGRLVVIGLHRSEGGRLYWTCKCDCGTQKVILGDSLRKGRTQSCGCYGRQRAIEANTGRRHSPESIERMRVASRIREQRKREDATAMLN